MEDKSNSDGRAALEAFPTFGNASEEEGTLSVSSRYTNLGMLLLLEAFDQSLKKRSQDLGTLPFRVWVRAAENVIDCLQDENTPDILYIAHEIGVVWRAKALKLMAGSRMSVYRSFDALRNAGFLTIVDPDEHEEAKAMLMLESHRKRTFSPSQVGEVYTIAEEFVDWTSDYIEEVDSDISCKSEVERVMKSLVQVRKQQEKMREALNTGHVTEDGTCRHGRDVDICAHCYAARNLKEGVRTGGDHDRN